MDFSHDNEYDALHARRVNESLAELQRTVKEHEIVLNKLRASAPIRSLPAVRPEVPLQIMKEAYSELASKAPFLPFPGSVLPSLIALRKTHQTVEDTRAYLLSQNDSVDRARKRLQIEQENLRDQQMLTRSLQNRIQSLRDGLDNRMDMGSEDIARERIAELKQKKNHYNKDTSALLKALRAFIDRHLAAMLAAEDLGGPVVGNIMEIDNDELAAGFSSQGKLRKVRENQDHDQDKRQRRIDEIWGQGQKRQIQSKDENRDESTAAGTDMKELTEKLLNSLVESDGDSTAAYVQLERETAAARFLVRSKVAQFHPKDSTRLRLIDFGRELDD